VIAIGKFDLSTTATIVFIKSKFGSCPFTPSKSSIRYIIFTILHFLKYQRRSQVSHNLGFLENQG
jgi:hypothetical protein